jgi:drug/metabolite transporter (DMT)-like permease
VTYSNLYRVVFWMTGALLSFCTMAVSIRGLAGTINIFEILTIRSASGLCIILALALARPELRPHLSWRHVGLHFIRNSVHFGGQYAWALSVTLLPLATVFALEFTMPAWVALIAVFALGERLTPSRIGAVLFGFLGVLVILRPGFETFRPSALLVLLAALLFAISIIATKKLTGSVTTFAILFWMNLLQLPMGLAGSDPLFLLRLGSEQLPWIAGVAIAGISSHYFLSNAFRAGDATVVVPLDFLRIPLIAVVGWLFYGETVDVLVFAGAFLIILGVLWNLRAETRRPAVLVVKEQNRPA